MRSTNRELACMSNLDSGIARHKDAGIQVVQSDILLVVDAKRERVSIVGEWTGCSSTDRRLQGQVRQ